MATPQERDFPPGHPAAADYDPASPEAREWARKRGIGQGERDFPVDHIKADDTPGNTNNFTWVAGIDPHHPELEPFTGRTAEQAKGHRDYYLRAAANSTPTPPREPTMAPAAVPDARKQRMVKVPGEDAFEFFCPGCGRLHKVDSRAEWNGSEELPTFGKAWLIPQDSIQQRCHFSLISGVISYYPDSGHKLAGQQLELPAIGSAQETIHA